MKGPGFSLASVHPGKMLTSMCLLSLSSTHPAAGPTTLPSCSQEGWGGLLTFFILNKMYLILYSVISQREETFPLLPMVASGLTNLRPAWKRLVNGFYLQGKLGFYHQRRKNNWKADRGVCTQSCVHVFL